MAEIRSASLPVFFKAPAQRNPSRSNVVEAFESIVALVQSCRCVLWILLQNAQLKCVPRQFACHLQQVAAIGIRPLQEKQANGSLCRLKCFPLPQSLTNQQGHASPRRIGTSGLDDVAICKMAQKGRDKSRVQQNMIGAGAIDGIPCLVHFIEGGLCRLKGPAHDCGNPPLELHRSRAAVLATSAAASRLPTKKS